VTAARERIAWAADVPLDEALRLWRLLRPHIGVVKVGLSLFVEHGPAAVRAFRDAGAQVFLDLKLHDIPNTVELAAARASTLGAALLTVHASGGEAMLRAAVTGAGEGAAKAGGVAPPRVLAVTALTSLDDGAVGALGFGSSAAGMAERLAEAAVRAGVGGLVCSAREVPVLRSRYPELFLCTPGIRLPGAATGDQLRTETPSGAIRAGANLLVVGRPLHGAPDPAAAARVLEAEVASTLRS
jgi:orotidine-5'-phosphate decarboxylase